MNRILLTLLITIMLCNIGSSCTLHEKEAVIAPSIDEISNISEHDNEPRSIGIQNYQIEPKCFGTNLSPIAFMPDSERILVRGESGVQIFNLLTMEEELFLKSPGKLSGHPVALSNNGEKLAWVLEDNSIQLIRISDQSVIYTAEIHSGPISELEFSTVSGNLFTAAHDGWVKELRSDGQVVNEFQPGGGEVLGLGVSADGKILATIPFDGPVRLWDTTNFQMLAELGGTGGYDTSDVAIESNGQFVTADLAAGLVVWDIQAQSLLWEGVNSMAFSFSPNGNILAYSDIGKGNDIILRSPDGKKILNTMRGHRSPVWELIFSPDGKFLASTDGIDFRIWQAADGELLYIGKSDCP